MKIFPIAIQTHLAARRLTLAMCCRATRTDGTVFGFTELDIDLPVAGVLYRAGALGFTMSASEATSTLAPDNHEVAGIISSDGITRFDVLAGKWDGCELYFFYVNYRSISDGVIDEAYGTMGNISTGTLTFNVEFLDFKRRLDQNVLRYVMNMCDADLGDARCKVDLTPYTQTLTVGPTPTSRSCVDTTRSEGDGWWDGGNALVLTGESAGLKMEIKSSAAAGAFEFLLPFFYGLEEGDTIRITPGCNKKKKVDGAFSGDCVVKYMNAVNFRGFDDVPGADKTLSYAT